LNPGEAGNYLLLLSDIGNKVGEIQKTCHQPGGSSLGDDGVVGAGAKVRGAITGEDFSI